MFTTGRSPRALLRQRDLHAILVVAGMDLAATIIGITTRSGSELNPFYRPFTGSLALMLLGAGIYLAVLLAASSVLEGDLRRVLASVVFGMHVGGVLSWMPLLADVPLNWWWNALAATMATALFYRWRT